MNKQKKPVSQASSHHIELSDEQLPNQWQLHANRLNFLENSVAKIQKKITKIQKSLIIVSESSGQLKHQFRSKLNEMIAIVSQPSKNDDNVSKDQFRSVMEEIKSIVEVQSQFSLNFQTIQRDIKKIQDERYFQGVPNEIRDFINDKVATSEIKTKKFIQEKVFAMTQSLNDLEKTLSLPRIPVSTGLNTSSVSKASSSQNVLSNSRSQSKLINSRASNLFEGSEGLRESAASKKLVFAEDEGGKFSDQAKTLSKHSNQGVPTNENSSRVVYLRQKLKEFEEINKKYDKKESEYESKQHEMTGSNQRSSNRQTSVKKNSSSLYTSPIQHYHVSNEIQPEQTPSIASSHSSAKHHVHSYQHEQQNVPSYNNQMQTTKKYSNGSISKTVSVNQESSARKLDKLKSIKDYLEQTQSEMDESFLQPNYQGRN